MGEDTEKRSFLSPRQTWSPHTAALHRRRQMAGGEKDKIMGALGGLSLDDDEEDLYVKSLSKSPTSKRGGKLGARPKANPSRNKSAPTRLRSKNSNRKAPVSPHRTKDTLDVSGATEKAASAKELSQKDILRTIAKYDKSVRSKLLAIVNPKTPLKERLQVEVNMMQHPEEKKVLSDFRYKVARQTLNIKILESEAADVQELFKTLEEEEKRQKEEDAEFAKRRQERIEEEIARQEREAKLAKDVKVHKAKGIASGAEALRKEAEKTQKAVARNKEKKELSEREKQKMIQDFINGEGKTMTDVERELRIARMLNEQVGYDSD